MADIIFLVFMVIHVCIMCLLDKIFQGYVDLHYNMYLGLETATGVVCAGLMGLSTIGVIGLGVLGAFLCSCVYHVQLNWSKLRENENTESS